MQCSRCGANVRPDMMECPECGAPLDQSQNASFPAYRPPDLYVPGGGPAPQQPATSRPPDLAPGQRPLGSLQRRLQRSQASMPNSDDFDDEGDEGDDIWRDLPPDRPARPSGPAQRSRASEGQGYGSRRPSSGADDGYSERGRRPRPTNEPAPLRGSRASSGNRPRPDDGYGVRDGYEDSREEPAYTPYPAYRPEWDESREGPAQRRSGRPDRYRAQDDRGDLGDSAEMSAEGPAYGPPRRPPARRSRPLEERRRDRDDYTNPLDDPRSPLRGGSQSRRPSQGGRGGRAPDAFAGGYGPGGSGYTEDEMRVPGYQDYQDYREYQGYDDRYGERGDGYGDAYSEEMRAAAPRGRSGHPAPYDLDEGASRERWALPGDARDVGFPSYEGAAYGQVGSSAGYAGGAGARQSGGSASRSRRSGSTSARKPQRKGGAARVVIGLLLLLAVVAVVGVEFGPKVYHKFLARTAGGGSPTTQTTITCATETSPTTQATPPAGQSLFATTAYTLTYPSSWQKNSQSGASASQCDVVYLFSQANGPAKFNVEEAGSFAPITDQQIIQAEAQSAQQQGSSFSEITSAATTQSVGGEVWQRREYQVTTKDSTKLHLALLAGHHKGAGFAIVLISSDTGFSSDDTTTFEPVLHSFQFV